MITKDDNIGEVVMNNPDLERIFKNYNIKVFGWGSMSNYRIGDAARIKDIDLEELLDELNSFSKAS